MTALAKGLAQLAAAGLACGLMLSLCGKGSRREVLRFGCACLMTVLLLAFLKRAELPWGDLAFYEDRLRLEVEQAQGEYRQALLVQTERDLARIVEEQAAALGLTCRAEVVCAADGQGRVTAQWAILTLGAGEAERSGALRQWTMSQLGLGEEQVIVEQEVGQEG